MGIEPMIRALQAPPLPLGHRAQTLVPADQPAENPYQSQVRCNRLSGSLCSQKQKPLDRLVFWRAVGSLNPGFEMLHQ